MTFQFKVRSKQNPHEECEKEINLLRDYNRALQKENESRNQQRKAMEAEIDRLRKIQLIWKQENSKYNSRVFNTIQSKQHTEIKEKYFQIKTKYENLLIQNAALTARIVSSQANASRLVTYENEVVRLNQQIKKHEVRYLSQQSKVHTYEKTISDLKNHQNTYSHTIQQEKLSKLKDFQNQIKLKNQEILKMQKEAISKQEQLGALKNDINNYAIKIDSLSEELAKLQKLQRIEIRYIEKDQSIILRSKLQQINNINGSLSVQVNSLRQDRINQVEIIKDLERRIAILEDTNLKLQNELHLSINSKKINSQISYQQSDNSLKNAVYALKAELQEVRNFNQLVRKQNDELYLQLKNQKIAKCNRCKHNHKSKSPIRHLEKGVIISKLTDQISNHSKVQLEANNHYRNDRQPYNVIPKQVKQRLTSELERSVNNRYNELQRKIQILQSQNNVLKQHLVHQV